MTQFTVRVELHRANQDDYDALHAAMEKRGFSREITSDSGQTYRLPTAEYNRSSDKTRDEIRDSASAAAKTTGKGFGILVTEAVARCWQGLKEV
jgi:Endoribonuclease GhoS